MSEERPEYADVVAAPVAGAQYRFFINLVGRADARRPVEMVFHAAVHRNATDADDQNVASGQVEKPGISRLVDRLRINDVEPQAVVQRDSCVRTPGILRVIEVPPLAFGRVRLRARVPPEIRDVTEQERGEPEPSGTLERCSIRAERQLAGSMRVARDSQVVGAPNVDAELEVVALHELGDVAYELELFFILIERAVAAVDAESRSEVEAADRSFDEPGRQPRGKRCVVVQSRNPGVLRRRGSEIKRQHVHLVTEKPEAKIREQV